MHRIALTFALKPGCYEKYKQAHAELWPEIVESLAQNQISMVIHHYQGRLFLFAVAPTKDHLDRHRGPAMDKFRQYMATLMVTGEDGRTISEPMDEAFVFGLFRSDGR